VVAPKNFRSTSAHLTGRLWLGGYMTRRNMPIEVGNLPHDDDMGISRLTGLLGALLLNDSCFFRQKPKGVKSLSR